MRGLPGVPHTWSFQRGVYRTYAENYLCVLYVMPNMAQQSHVKLFDQLFVNAHEIYNLLTWGV